MSTRFPMQFTEKNCIALPVWNSNFKKFTSHVDLRKKAKRAIMDCILPEIANEPNVAKDVQQLVMLRVMKLLGARRFFPDMMHDR